MTCATLTKDFYNKQIIEFAIVNDGDASRTKSVDYIRDSIAMTDNQYRLSRVVR